MQTIDGRSVSGERRGASFGLICIKVIQFIGDATGTILLRTEMLSFAYAICTFHTSPLPMAE